MSGGIEETTRQTSMHHVPPSLLTRGFRDRTITIIKPQLASTSVSAA